MKRSSVLLLSLLAGMFLAKAETTAPVGTIIKGFTLPQRNEKGEPEVNITGDQAHVVTINRTTITNLLVELYEDGQMATWINSPECDLWRNEGRLTTQKGVMIDRDGLKVRAQSLDWLYKEKRGFLKGKVQVTVQDFQLGGTPGTAPTSGAPSLLDPLPPVSNPFTP